MRVQPNPQVGMLTGQQLASQAHCGEPAHTPCELFVDGQINSVLLLGACMAPPSSWALRGRIAPAAPTD